MSKKIKWLVTLAMPLFLLVACDVSTLPDDDQAAIYAAAARQLYTVDHTFGDNPPNFPIVYLVGCNDFEDDVEYFDIRESVKTAVIDSLKDLPAEFIWIDSLDDPVIDRIFQDRENRDAFFTLGNLELQEDGLVQMLASLYFGSAGGFGTTYVLEKVNGHWQITGRTGRTWMS